MAVCPNNGGAGCGCNRVSIAVDQGRAEMNAHGLAMQKLRERPMTTSISCDRAHSFSSIVDAELAARVGKTRERHGLVVVLLNTR